MPIVKATLHRIVVHKAGEGTAEWRLRIEGNPIAGGTGNGEKTFESDDVTDGSEHPLNTEWVFDLNPKEKLRIKMSGRELDGPFDPDDVLPGVEVDVDPFTAGSDFPVSGGSEDGEFYYTVVMGFTV